MKHINSSPIIDFPTPAMVLDINEFGSYQATVEEACARYHKLISGFCDVNHLNFSDFMVTVKCEGVNSNDTSLFSMKVERNLGGAEI
jgi:hypothetical protein